MATPMPASNTDDDIIPIEIDEPGSAPHASADEATEPPLELDMEPIEPEWLRSARRRIALADTHGAVNDVVRNLQTLTEAQKVQVRPLVFAQRSKIDAAANKHACEVAQAIGKHRANCVHCALQRVPQSAEPLATFIPPISEVQPAPVLPRPMVATWTRIQSGPSAGKWGIRVEHLQYGVAIRRPMVGENALVNRSGSAGGSQVKRITGVVTVNATRGVSICTVADPSPGERASLVTPRSTVEESGLPAAPAPAQEPIAPPQEAATPAQEATSGLESALGAIAGEGAANAAVTDLGAQSSTAASSSAGRRLGVGFSSPAQYLEALQRGGLQPHTRAEYLRTVRAAGLTFDEDALPPANTATLPVGPGILHTPTEPSIFDRPKAERGLKVGDAAKQVKSGAALLRAGDLIAGSIAGGAGGDFSWAGRGKITRAALLATLAEIGRESDAPAAKNAHAQAGRAVTSLRSLGYHVHAVQGEERKGLPAHVAHRYIVGRPEVGDSQTTAIGAEYGRRVLVVDLHQDDTLHCEGQADAAARVKADFEARCAADIYVSADLTSWLQRTLRDVHGATRFGVGWYVPAGQREAGERLTRAVAKIWGESWRHGMPVAACAHLFEGLTEGLADEVRKIEEEWAGAKEKAAEAHKLSVGTRAAAGLLGKVTEVGERVRGYAVLLGDDNVAPLKARLARLDGEIRPLTDDTSARASMLEFS